jgi:hypothetical protein
MWLLFSKGTAEMFSIPNEVVLKVGMKRGFRRLPVLGES